MQLPISGPAGVDSLARLGFEVAGVRRDAAGLFAVIVVGPESERLLGPLMALAAPVPGAPPAAAAADTFRVYRSFDKAGTGVRATLAAWAAADSNVHVDSIGASGEGRPVLAVKVGPSGDDPGRPNVLFLATHHAREWVSTAVALRLIRWLADSLPPVTRAARDIWVIPVENPDGYQYTFTTDRFWRKNRRLNGDGTVGVDPNRNYPAFWGIDDAGSSPVSAAETYRGPAPGSEPETQAVMAFHAAHPPVLAVSFHSYSALVLYPYGFRAGEFAADVPVYRALAGTDLTPAVPDGLPGSVATFYHPGPAWNLYPTNGEYTDWAYRAHGTIAFTIELTSGCCDPSTSGYYGFAFPDDSVLVERVFRDQLPFALAVIGAAGNVAGAAGPAGVAVTAPRVESVWPEARVSLPVGAAPPFGLTVRTASGNVVTRGLQIDSLRRGVARAEWRSDVTADHARALHVDGPGLTAELMTLAGAEDGESGWHGWTRTGDALVGSWSWNTTAQDTLTLPVADLRGRTRVWLQFWTKHRGSTFTPEQRGRVQLSTDSGTSWSDVLMVVGDGPAWYPVRVDLPAAAGARAAVVRFVSEGLSWWVDAVGFASDSTELFAALAVPGAPEVSENPVRSNQVVIAWPVGTGATTLGIYSFTGERLVQETMTPGVNEYVWDVTVGGRPAPNGAYIVVVQVDGTVYRRRLFVARP